MGKGKFDDETFPALHDSWGRIRDVIIADFDNDGHEEIFLHNAATTASVQPNVLLKKVCVFDLFFERLQSN
jgi:hypothetical protein